MKIAIQGHPTRGNEVIQILESLGGKKTELTGTFPTFYHLSDKNEIINNHKKFLSSYKLYTLEEFEKEFPFKIGDEVIFPIINGWASGKIIGIKDFEYVIKTRHNYHYVEPYQLSLYPMKEERNITLTLDKAKEWYKKGGELKEIALQAFSEKELNPLPRSWEEFCKRYPIKKDESYINSEGKILSFTTKTARRDWNHICPSKQSAEAHLAMIQLEQLRNCWWGDWKPEWDNSEKFIIKWDEYNLTVLTARCIHAFLFFPTRKMAEGFLRCFRDLIEKAGNLI